ncbi:MAG: cupin domain-containing protein [Gammaproteobacteria bacterium]
MNIFNLESEFARLEDYWSPRIVDRVNDQYVKVAKIKGEFTWHKHDDEDELFYVVKGNLVIQYEDCEVALGAGDLHVVPRNTLHNPVAEEECWVCLIETVTTKHTGDVVSPLTRTLAEQAR